MDEDDFAWDSEDDSPSPVKNDKLSNENEANPNQASIANVEEKKLPEETESAPASTEGLAADSTDQVPEIQSYLPAKNLNSLSNESEGGLMSMCEKDVSNGSHTSGSVVIVRKPLNDADESGDDWE